MDISRSVIGSGGCKLLVRVSEPTLVTELQTFFTAMLHAEIRERHNHVEISFPPGVDPAAEKPRVERLAWAWQLAGHVDVHTDVKLVPSDTALA